MNLEEILYKKFGYKSFRKGQQAVIKEILRGKDVLGILPTGTGKTLCYQLPSLLLSGMTVVVSPLLSLMEDQVHQLRASGDKRVVQLNSLLSFAERKETLHNLQDDALVFISPEMLSNEYVLQVLSRYKISLIAIDEAHCISQWGHEFRTDYLRLREVIKKLNSPQCVALTATATKKVAVDIIEHLGMNNPAIHRHSVNRPEISIIMDHGENVKEKDNKLMNWVNVLKKPGIIYVGTRNEAERMNNILKDSYGRKIAYYHAGLTKEDRLLVQRQFLNDELDWIVATNAFGMGINKSNVCSVIHMYMPSSIEQYVQEIGRAGRGGQNSTAVSILSIEDRFLPISFIEREFPTENELNTWFYKGYGSLLADREYVNVEEIKEVFQIDDTLWRMIQYYLEQESIVKDNMINTDNLTTEVLSDLNERFAKRSSEKLERLAQYERFTNTDGCLRQYLLHYFGESTSEQKICCSNCNTKKELINDENIDRDVYVPIEKQDFHYSIWEKELENIFLTP
ncbi:RecQ family ATP-dependent DNA helicase [Bacillus shivajii]|uniref:RecQ family ATP-dependent DNA helicase n=1 Tax=Bacillus shivajii TaxID=1983719 RepID=UPI001CFBCB1F|nr:RecQ family ATP-dependent DNA helicase [Bacillus shivajii]UCZ54736.1 RecQ family ATP-dependent DNA helicase [Bacillus shivajii]